MGSVVGDGSDESVQLLPFLFEFLDQAFDGSLGESLRLAALPVTHQAPDNAHASVGRIRRLLPLRRCR